MNQFRRDGNYQHYHINCISWRRYWRLLLLQQTENYLKTENAKIDGKVIPIASPVAGKLTDWKAEVGKNYNENDKLGVTVAGANGEQTVDVTIPKKMQQLYSQTQQLMRSLGQVAQLLMHLI